jgi:hypothetical protein
MPAVVEDVPVQIQQYDSHIVPSIINIQAPMPVLSKQQSMPMLVHGHPQHGLPIEQTDVAMMHPAKKIKSSIFSKFLPTTLTRPGY